jgi:hypothetical protein
MSTTTIYILIVVAEEAAIFSIRNFKQNAMVKVKACLVAEAAYGSKSIAAE